MGPAPMKKKLKGKISCTVSADHGVVGNSMALCRKIARKDQAKQETFLSSRSWSYSILSQQAALQEHCVELCTAVLNQVVSHRVNRLHCRVRDLDGADALLSSALQSTRPGSFTSARI